MDSKILTAIENHADDNDRASEIYFETVNMDKRELADYVASHLEELRELLGIRDLATKDGAPELTKEFWDMVKLGRSIQNPDPYQKHDYYGDDLKTVDSYMEDFGVQKENGEYNDDLRAAFTNPENPAYYGNFDRDMVRDLAQRDNISVDEYLDKIRRTADSWQRGNQARGYNADNGLTWRWFTDLGQELVFPRVREKKLAGQGASAEDFIGDLAELGLNFVPGVGILNKFTGKVVAKMPETLSLISRIGVEGLESAAVPLGSQALDIALYSDDDPRGDWKWERVGAQYTGAVGAKGVLKMAGSTAKNAASMNAGKAGEDRFRNAMKILEDVGYDAENSIARRGMAQRNQAAKAMDPRYNDETSFLTPEQNKSGYMGDLGDVKRLNDFEVKRAEAERLAKSQGARKAYATAKRNLDEVDEELYVLDNTLAEAEEDGLDAVIYNGKEVSVADLQAKRDAALAKRQKAEAKVQSTREKYISADNDGKNLVQLDDGSLMYNEYGVVGGLDVDGSRIPMYYTTFDDYVGTPTPIPAKVTVLKNFDDPIPDSPTVTKGIGKGMGYKPVTQTVEYAPRDKVVRPLLEEDKDFSSVASGRAKWNKPVNIGANVVFNAGAREGWVGQGLGLDEKRQAALYNQMLMKLRPLVAESGKSPEGKRRTVDAIMNVMDYGLDNLPEEMYKKDKATYKAIAAQLGSKDWSHWSESKVKDYPTTSKSTAR